MIEEINRIIQKYSGSTDLNEQKARSVLNSLCAGLSCPGDPVMDELLAATQAVSTRALE